MRTIILSFALLLVAPSASYATECSEAMAAAAAVQLASCATLVGFTVEAPLTATQTTQICATCTSLADATKRKAFGDCTVADAKTSTTVILQTKFDALFVCPSTSSPSSSGSGSAEIETPLPATKTPIPTPTPTPIVSSLSGSGSAMPPVPTIIETLSPGSDDKSQSSSGSLSPNSNSSSSSRGDGGTSSGSGSRNGTTPINSSVTATTTQEIPNHDAG
uniref:Elicitin-like protein n=1 Tax=Globisporangium ultimum (strain ATCC 200006 / CBS 805.95 / DAOM BR144) TaxID=431595 RepID=K3WNB0_GLOUD